MAYGYNTPSMDASLRYLPTEIKVAKFDESKITFRKRPFLPLGEARCKHEACGERCTSRARIQYVLTHPPLASWLNRWQRYDKPSGEQNNFHFFWFLTWIYL